MKVVDPAGETWRIKRRWLPWRPRLRDGALDTGVQLTDAVGDTPFLLALVGLILIPVAVLLAVFVAEIALLLLVISALTLVRTLWIRRWPIEVFRAGQRFHSEDVRGWDDSRRRILEIADGIRLGAPPAPARRHRREV